jgi:hypothetical protein
VGHPLTGSQDVVLPGSQQLAPAFFLFLCVVAIGGVAVGLLRRRRRARRGEPAKRPVVTACFAVAALLAAVMTAATWPPPFEVPTFAPLPQLLPDDAVFYRSASDLPVSEDSERWIAALGDLRLGAGFSGEVVDGVVFGIPFNEVGPSTPTQRVSIELWGGGSYQGDYPISDPAYIESMPTYGFDQHYIAVDRERRLVWELLNARAWFGRWQADSGARWSMDDLEYGEGSTIAAGLPLLPGTITYDEVASGRIGHVILSGTPTSAAGRWIWPARGTDGRSEDPDAPPQGAWLRLRDDVDLSELGPQARVVAEALREYGTVLSDTGPGFGLRGTPDDRWDEADLASLAALRTDDFEVVDPSSAMISAESLAVRPPR